MIHARQQHNPPDFRVDSAFVNPYNDPAVGDADAVTWSLGTGALCGTPRHVAEQVAALRDAGAGHLLCQLSFGYLAHAKILASMHRFANEVMPSFPTT